MPFVLLNKKADLSSSQVDFFLGNTLKSMKAEGTIMWVMFAVAGVAIVAGVLLCLKGKQLKAIADAEPKPEKKEALNEGD